MPPPRRRTRQPSAPRIRMYTVVYIARYWSAEMASSYTATDAAAYERLMGRWSVSLAEELISFAGLAPGDSVLDVGCGTGSLVMALSARREPAAIVGLDIAAPYIAYAAERFTDPRVSFVTGDAV